MHMLFYVISLLISTFGWSGDIPNCEQSLIDGLVVEKPTAFDAPADSKIYRLGSGAMGGVVYRVTDANQKSETYKVYYSHETKNRDHSLVRDHINIDLERMIKLTYFLNAQTAEPKFKIPKVSLYSKHVMKLEDVRGTTLKDIILGDFRTATEKKKIQELYDLCLKNLVNEIKRHHPKSRSNPHGLITLDETSNVYYKFFIHADNIIVTEKNELVIIDPY